MGANKSEEYNGWSNYETWLVKLWIDNEQSSQEFWLEQARECSEQARDSEFSKADRIAVMNLADMLEEEHERIPELSGIYADLLNASLSRVDWHEIAEALIEDAKELA